MTSPRDRLDSEQPSRSTTVQTDIPPIFILGVVLMAVVVGGLLLRSALATPRAAAATANPSPAPGRTATQATPTPDPTPYLNLRGYVWPLIGATVGSLLSISEHHLGYLLALYVGFFLFIGATDLLPAAHEHPSTKKVALTVAGFVFVFVISLAGAR